MFIDEHTMAHTQAFAALDKTLYDLKRCNVLVDGIMLLLLGNFLQTLLVVLHSTATDELNTCLKLSHLWNYIKTWMLNTNMRAPLDRHTIAGEFASLLLKISGSKITKVVILG